ncbi:tRNA 2-thiouridine synthesizing protein E [Thioalkalivibrio nitratireducens DSM 14787]|uniref:Sulfurtransferase n=1 Tax=Thioalkalivibrio nitratireducens (strain DSM 14787 / UNIQEM 213 / ALEN2) TaxID=1255043 RepID=L0DWU3_THIND|nr:TusE/DsrC/DsvC family sulfur relay protein [Thioalkalivibrio nitratireducens]AGA33420.1 tRNA 2-thiouridine synthesizing protein E [Thioalkalivibrio nitratireducens DSM 14787]
MATETIERTYVTDEEGYLVDPESWTPEVAEQFAEQEGIALSDEHWAVIRFIREYYDEHQIAVDARFVIKFLDDEFGYGAKAHNYLFKLFPYGYVKQACRIAGMRRPRAWSTG